jgi:hypothetical protein
VIDDAYLSELRQYIRPMVVKALDDIRGFRETRGCLLGIFFVYFEEEVLSVCCVLCNSFEAVRCNLEVPLPLATLKNR